MSIVYIYLRLFFLLSCTYITVTTGSELEKLPFCSDTDHQGIILVSTLDGKLSALNNEGNLKWELQTDPGPLLVSNIHNIELTNNGKWIRIIPSLSGTLYKFDSFTIDPIPISAESLLKSSFRHSDDLVVAGSIEIRTYGIGFRSGKLFYECTPSKCSNGTDQEKLDDVLVIERSTQTVRALESRTGNEKWNFSVGQHNIKLPQVSCVDPYNKLAKWQISAVLPDGLVHVTLVKSSNNLTWKYKFTAPIARVWIWDGLQLTEVDLFISPNQNFENDKQPFLSPAIYLGMHNKQLYIHESLKMQNALTFKKDSSVAVTESRSLSKIPWKPIPASENALAEEDSTALAVLYGSEYVNGNGFFLYTEKDIEIKNTELCENNETIEAPVVEMVIGTMWIWWKQIIVISISTAIIFHMLFRTFTSNKGENKEIVYVPIVDVTQKRLSESSETSIFDSRYINDFDTLTCLGKGGFGVVFEVKQKIDECNYAIKRIKLPNEQRKRDRVMREVKALAKLEHQNIVRYFNSWVEKPPIGWQKEHDRKWIEDVTDALSQSTYATETISHRRSQSVSIKIEDVPEFTNNSSSLCCPNNLTDGEDSHIVFEDVSNKSSDTITTECSSVAKTSHSQKKINWKRPFRKSHSLDLSRNFTQIEPPIFLYIQMQLCKKENLKEWLEVNPKRDYDVILDIFRQILDAVEYVHNQNLIHRDLKPSNIFFSLEGQVKIGDFGLVKDMEDCLDLNLVNMNSSHLGHTKEVGTQLYMSPEQLLNKKYNYKVDIYSLGLIFFELLVPFSTDMEKYKVLKNLRDNVYPLNFEKNYPNEYHLLTMMLCDDPNKRLCAKAIKEYPPICKNFPKIK